MNSPGAAPLPPSARQVAVHVRLVRSTIPTPIPTPIPMPIPMPERGWAAATVATSRVARGDA